MKIEKYLETIEDLSTLKIAVTGATSGVGHELVHHLVKKGAKVVLLALEDDLGKKVQAEHPENVIDVIKYDQSSFRSIEESINLLLERHPDIDTYVLDAGTLGEKGLTIDGYARTIGVNYCGVKHFIDYLSNKVGDRKIRFVIQGSIVGGLRLKKNTDLRNEKLGFFTQYNVSKIYLEAYFYKLFKENKYQNIEYILTEPGITSTNITRNMPKFIRVLGKGFLLVFFHHPNKACLTLLKGICPSTPNGSYIVPRGLLTMSGYPKIKEFPNKRKREYLFKE